MQLIVGLGNPGTKYAGTRHNAGFMAFTAIAEKYGVTRWKEEHQAHTATINVDGEKVMLVMPQTFMNLSGDAVGPLMRYYKLSPADVIVIYDDMDLPVGQLRLRVKGSAGGHNGMKSVIAHLGTDQFPHVRIGIGRPQPGWTVIDHVLARPQEDDAAAMAEGVQQAAEAAVGICTLGMDLAMNRFNPLKRAR